MTSQWVVIKFGGTSVSSEQTWSNIKHIVERHLQQGLQVLVVCSAISGVSNLLESLLIGDLEQDHASTLQSIQEKYTALMQALNVEETDYFQQNFSKLNELVNGIKLLGEVTPKVHARVMAFGELLLTHLGATYLKQQGLDAIWQDARDYLTTESEHDLRHPDVWLNAYCNVKYDADCVKKLLLLNRGVVVTQGFIAKNKQGDTVILGRGGSDTSAAYFASKLNALRCEIWTDVPGIYTANPRQIPQARMISHLDYDEAQEIASMGAKVLHPQSIFPVSVNNIPLHVRYTLKPDRAGTEIYKHNGKSRSQIKSILIKNDVILVSIETVSMWHKVGFLKDIFQCFENYGISIDLVSTSEAAVTVSLDANINTRDKTVLDALLVDLNRFSRAHIIAPCASVSLVGRDIRAILHQLGDAFALFEEQKVYLLSQAANDLNLTFVVDEDQALRLATKLHYLLIEQKPVGDPFHLSWAEEFGGKIAEMESPWWVDDRSKLLALAAQSTPQYVYSERQLQHNLSALLGCDAINRAFYSIKANNNRFILQKFYESGLSFESVSIEELSYLLELFPSIDKTRLLFTPNFASRQEYEKAIALGVWVTVDSLYPLQHWAESFSGQEILIRVDLGKGSGHHKYVVTGGDKSKFGIPLNDLEAVKSLVEKYRIKVIGLHSHAGSGILNPQHWSGIFKALAELVEHFPTVTVINVGGGLGIPERPGQQPLDLSVFNDSLKTIKSEYPNLQLWMEPGRYLVAQAGVILAQVTQIKDKGDLHFVGINTGMNSLIRPALYGSYHEIVNLTRLDEASSIQANIVGPICESGDTLGYSRCLPRCQEGDVILIANSGAYGYTMASHYNLRLPASEYYMEL